MTKLGEMGPHGDTLGFWDWLLHRKKKPNASERYIKAKKRYLALRKELHDAWLELQRSKMALKTRGHAVNRRPYRRRTTRTRPRRVETHILTPKEQRELSRRMRWGWAQRPGAPDMPGEAAAKRASMARYRSDLRKRIITDIIRKRHMGRARRPGAPDMPGEAAEVMRRAGVPGY